MDESLRVDGSGALYRELERIHTRPAPFSVNTVRMLWDDEYISERMLEYHLDPASEPASRPHEFIDRSCRWLVDHFSIGGGSRVVDFGCGPGLYTTRLARSGAAVTGIDFSRRSIAYAKSVAEAEGLSIDYVLADYLEYMPSRPFDLITLIYCDVCALSPPQRRRLFSTFRDLLAEGGAVLFDVVSLATFERRRETSSIERRQMNGFWAKGDYFGLTCTFVYEKEKVVLDRYTIVEPHRVRDVYNWLQYFSVDSLAAELGECGLAIDEVYGNVAGDLYDESSDVFAIVAVAG